MEFDIIQKDQYLNVCIWSRSQEKNEKDILLGYVRYYLSCSKLLITHQDFISPFSP